MRKLVPHSLDYAVSAVAKSDIESEVTFSLVFYLFYSFYYILFEDIVLVIGIIIIDWSKFSLRFKILSD